MAAAGGRAGTALWERSGAGGGGSGDVPGRSAPRRRVRPQRPRPLLFQPCLSLPGAASPGPWAPPPPREQHGQRDRIHPGVPENRTPLEGSVVNNATAPAHPVTCSPAGNGCGSLYIYMCICVCVCMYAHTHIFNRVFLPRKRACLNSVFMWSRWFIPCQHWMLSLHVQGLHGAPAVSIFTGTKGFAFVSIFIYYSCFPFPFRGCNQ